MLSTKANRVATVIDNLVQDNFDNCSYILS